MVATVNAGPGALGLPRCAMVANPQSWSTGSGLHFGRPVPAALANCMNPSLKLSCHAALWLALLAAAEEARRRQAELLAMVAKELSDPFAPIRLAASTLGIPGAEAALLPRVQLVIEEQAERLARMVRETLEQQGVDRR